MEIIAKGQYIKTAPRKIRLICDLIRGKKLIAMIDQLKFFNKQAAYDVITVLQSAQANAQQKNLDVNKLLIKEIRCDAGPALKRTLLHSRGRATQIKKRMSHITVVLSDERKSEILIAAKSGSAAKAEFPKSQTKSNVKI